MITTTTLNDSQAGTASVPVRRMNVLAVVALVLSLYVPLAGIICGHLALGQVRERGEDGEGIAKAGLIVSYIYFGVMLLMFFVVTGIVLSMMTLTTVSR